MANKEAKTPSTKGPAGPRIDRGRFEPPYYQLANILRREIATGILRPGDRVLSETQLCERYEVSPMTARRALTLLLDEGLVTAARGRGTFVKPLVLSTATFGLHALEEMFSGERISVRFLSVKTTPATQRISRRLLVPAGDKVISIRRLLLRGGEAVAYHREYLIYDPSRPIVEAEMGITSLQGLFDGTGETVLQRGHLAIQATVLTEDEARLLNAAAGSAAFRIEHTFYDFDEQPVSWGWFIVPGTFLEFNATVGAQPVVT
ncbi:MAG: GntR family transcriptional regulator [Chloroflexi bacterium]|nr:MAG: GntR family transcriptional regulator [Chloroflexota bacterium]